MAKWRDVKQNRIDIKEEQSSKSTQKHTINSDLLSISARFKAFTTDTFLIAMPIIYLVMYLIMGGGEGFATHKLQGWAIFLSIHFIITAIFWLRKGQTPGLKAYEGKLVTYDGKKVGFLHVLLRYFFTTLSIATIILPFYTFFRKDKKSFQDILSNTMIINYKD